MTDLSPQHRFLLGLLSVSVALLGWYGLRVTGLVTADTLASPAEVWTAGVWRR